MEASCGVDAFKCWRCFASFVVWVDWQSLSMMSWACIFCTGATLVDPVHVLCAGVVLLELLIGVVPVMVFRC